MNIVFIGLSGSGKTTFGNYCSNLLKMPFIDTDEDLSKKFGDISAIFSGGGESLFRELEERVVIEAASENNCIIATGGGVVTNANAMRALKANGLIVYLKCDTKTLALRLEKSAESRPLISSSGKSAEETLNIMIEERGRLYNDYADVILDESGILSSRNLLQEDLGVQLGALYLELVLKLEKKVYSKLG